jgi:exoribonuclease R
MSNIENEIVPIIQNSKYIAGILILEKNKTYGRTPNKKRLYYVCIPFQKHLPHFLVPYEIPIGFEKVFPNHYVLFKFDHWTPQEKHPYGTLIETIGKVNDLNSGYEYQLYARNVHFSCTPMNKILKKKKIDCNLDHNLIEIQYQILREPETYGPIENREKIQNIFTIDPNGCKDRDDALSIQPTQNSHQYQVSVHIANVWVWISFFKLWDFLQETNISTIYLPHRNVSMLPTELSEKICSLDSDHPCFAITMDFLVDIDKNTIQKLQVQSTMIHIHRNFDYESKSLLNYRDYQTLLKISQHIHPEITDSHELVSFWMMKMNQEMARELYSKKTGIFRITKTETDQATKKNVDSKKEDMLLYIWENSISGEYILYDTKLDRYHDESTIPNQFYHGILDIPMYIHFTSPIRRMVDIYNQLMLINTKFTDTKPEINNFLANISIAIEKINRDTKIIRKIQTESNLLHIFQEKIVSISNMEDRFISCSGQILQIEDISSSINTSAYQKILVYLPKYRCMIHYKNQHQHISNKTFQIKQIVDCKIFLLEKKEDFKKKIKMDIF